MRLTVHETYAFTATGWYGWCLTLSMQRAPKNLLCMNMFVYACVLYTLVYCGFSTCNSFLIGPCKHCALRTRIRKCCERTRISFYFAASLLPVSLLYWRFLHYFEYVHDLFHIYFFFIWCFSSVIANIYRVFGIWPDSFHCNIGTGRHSAHSEWIEEKEGINSEPEYKLKWDNAVAVLIRLIAAHIQSMKQVIDTRFSCALKSFQCNRLGDIKTLTNQKSKRINDKPNDNNNYVYKTWCTHTGRQSRARMEKKIYQKLHMLIE